MPATPTAARARPLDHKAFLAAVPPETRARLTRTSDAPGLIRLTGHAGLIALLATYVAFALPLWPLALPPLGIALAFLFTLQHECTHRTPFRTGWINEAVGLGTGLILVQPFLWFRAFHMAHHRHTNAPGRDPELAEAKPESRRGFLWHLSTLGYWKGKFTVLAANAAGRARGDFIPDRQRPAIRREARAMIAAYAAALAFSVLVSPILLWIWLLPLALGFPLLRLYLLAEHGRCPAVADMFGNSRTTLTGRLVRFLAWNMPYHAEHHAWPAVPFHRLPELHALARPHLKHLAPGYADFARRYARALS